MLAKEALMPDYRLYRMNPHTGHIDGVEEFHSGDDVEAILLVQNRPRATPVELWCGGRKVTRLDAGPEAGGAFAPGATQDNAAAAWTGPNPGRVPARP